MPSCGKSDFVLQFYPRQADALNPVPRAGREIRDPELEELYEILTQEPFAAPAAQQDDAPVLTDARIVELGDP